MRACFPWPCAGLSKGGERRILRLHRFGASLKMTKLYRRLKDGDGAARRIGHNGHPADVWNLDRAHMNGGAKRSCFLGRSIDVVDPDIRKPALIAAGHRGHASVWPSVRLKCAIDAGRSHVRVPELPAEQGAVKFFRFGEVRGIELEVNEGVSHVESPPGVIKVNFA